MKLADAVNRLITVAETSNKIERESRRRPRLFTWSGESPVIRDGLEWAIAAYKEGEIENEIDRYVSRLEKIGGWELQYLEGSDDPDYVPTHADIRELLENWPHWATDEPDIPQDADISDLDVLRDIFNLDLSHLVSPSPPLLPQCQFYALLALIKIDKAAARLILKNGANTEGGLIHPGLASWAVGDTVIAGNLLIESMEIVCWAERELSNDALKIARSKEKQDRTSRDLIDFESKEKRARSERGRMLAAKRWETLKPARERAKVFIAEALDEWLMRNPKQYANQGDFARAMADKIDIDENGDPVYSASSIQVKLIPLLRQQK